MEEIIEVLSDTWQGYGISDSVLYIGLLAAAICAYVDWQKTCLAAWGLFYLWSMFAILSDGAIIMEEGFNAIWVCGYGLLGFFLLGILIYTNLKS
jgi:hypothetical protein